jgi:hypothetical protein
MAIVGETESPQRLNASRSRVILNTELPKEQA